MFELVSEFKPTGDQPEAIKYLVDGLNSGNVQFFLMNKANKYTFNEEKSWYEYKDTSDASYVSFASKWFDLSPSGFNYVSIKEANDEITIGMEMKFDDNEIFMGLCAQVTKFNRIGITRFFLPSHSAIAHSSVPPTPPPF